MIYLQQKRDPIEKTDLVRMKITHTYISSESNWFSQLSFSRHLFWVHFSAVVPDPADHFSSRRRLSFSCCLLVAVHGHVSLLVLSTRVQLSMPISLLPAQIVMNELFDFLSNCNCEKRKIYFSLFGILFHRRSSTLFFVWHISISSLSVEYCDAAAEWNAKERQRKSITT